MPVNRREVLFGGALGLLWSRVRAVAGTIKSKLPWRADAGQPPVTVRPGPWQFFSPGEAAAVESIVDRLIPPDSQTPGGKDAGCAVYIDRQLAGPFGKSQGLYREGPFVDGTPQQGPQTKLTPAEKYRQGLAALDRYCRSKHGGRGFAALAEPDRDAVLHGLEDNTIVLDGSTAKDFFTLLLQTTLEGFFADPVYGGNRDMCAWKMIGFPGARYDYRDWIERHNERFPLPPVSIRGRTELRRS